MSNVLSEEKRQQVIALGRLGWPLRRIEQETGVRRETAGSYLKAAGIAVRPPGAWGRRPPAKPANEVTTGSDAAQLATVNLNPNPENLSNKGKAKTTAKPANEVITGFGVELGGPGTKNPKPALSVSACEPFRDAIELDLSRGRTAMAIWQDLTTEHGFRGGYQTVKRFVRKLRGNQPPQPRAVIVSAPGEEAQVDYGKGPMTREPQSGKYRRTRLFVMTLGCSRKAARFLTFRSSSRIWAELHEKAFRRFGGSTRVVVLDNLREGVLVPDIYDPALNPLYRDVLAHYGAVALPCRIKDPDRKGKVESGVGHAQRALQGKRFESLAEAQAYALPRFFSVLLSIPRCEHGEIRNARRRQSRLERQTNDFVQRTPPDPVSQQDAKSGWKTLAALVFGVGIALLGVVTSVKLTNSGQGSLDGN